MNIQATQGEIRPKSTNSTSRAENGYIASQRKVSIDEAMATQAAERGFDPMPLQVDLLIQRIKQGGHSGQFLADAFLCTYRPHLFNHSLWEVHKLDAEAFRLFHQVLHIRHIPGWRDDALFEIEKRVREVMKEGGAQ